MILGHNYSDEYSEYVFEQNPFMFIGTYDQLENHFEDLSLIYKKNYKINNIRENLLFWQNPRIHNLSIDIEEVKKCKYYALEKGENYLKLHNYLNN